MEQRLARISNNGGRNQTHSKVGSLYAKTSPPETVQKDQLFLSASSNIKEEAEAQGLPNLKNVKKTEHKAMI